MKPILLTVASGCILAGLFSCSRPLDPTLAPTPSFVRVAFVFQADSTDFYSAKAISETDLTATHTGSTWGTPLFDKTEPVTYLLNNRPTANRQAVKTVFLRKNITDIRIGRQNGQKTVTITYDDQPRLITYKSR